MRGLPTPKGAQLEVLGLPAVGHHVILGTAGSGKTLMAVLRAEYLAELQPTARVLLVTFNRSLVAYCKALRRRPVTNVDVLTYHQLATSYMKSRGIALRIDQYPLKRVQAALEAIRLQYPDVPILSRPPELFANEFRWMARSGITSLDEYLATNRSGAADTRIDRDSRPYVFKVYERYLQERTAAGYSHDWDDLSLDLLYRLGEAGVHLYDHVIIDEGQDFAPTMLRALVKMTNPKGSVTFFGDVAQQIYGARTTWRSAGLQVDRVIRFEENYRNTRQVAQLALALCEMFRTTPDIVLPKEPRADGPLPMVIEFDTKEQERQSVIDLARKLGRTQQTVILLRTRQDEKLYLNSLRGANVCRLHRSLRLWSRDPGVWVGTYHASKGMEFDAVIMPECTADNFPHSSRLASSWDDNEARVDDARLLYVGITRARTRLIITYTGQLTSLLPNDDQLYERVKKT